MVIRTERPIRIVVIGVILVQLILAWQWIRIDAMPPYWDEAGYLYQGALQYDALRDGGLVDWYSVFAGFERIRPSLVPALTVPFFALFGIDGDVGLLVNLVALVVLLLATYGLGSSIDTPRTGLLAMLLVGSYPVLVGLVHILLIELVMVALVAAALLALWKSDGFRHTGWSVAAGLLVGLGSLTKVFFVAFVAGPWLVIVLQMVLHGTWRSKRHLGNLALSLLAGAIVASIWYAPNLLPALERTLDAGVGAEASPYGPANPLHWTNLVAYFFRFVGTGTSLIGFLLVLLGLAGLGLALVRAKKEGTSRFDLNKGALVFLASSVLLGYAVFTSLNNQDLKHVTGILPALAVLTGWGITRLSGRAWVPVTALVLIVALALSTIGTFPGRLPDIWRTVPVVDKPLALFYPAQPAVLSTRYAAPDPSPWPLDALLSYALLVADLESLPHDQVRLTVIPNYPGLESSALRFKAYQERLPFEVVPAEAGNLADQDLLIHKTGDMGWAYSLPAIEDVLEKVSAADSEFKQMPRTFALPDGSEAFIYGRRPSPLLSGPPSPQYPSRAEFGNSARFLGFDAERSEPLEEGQTLVLTYYWESLAPTDGDYHAFVHLMNPDTEEIVAQDDHLLFPNTYPTSWWQPERWLFDRRQIVIPDSYSGSSLQLRLGLYNEDGRLPVTWPADAAATHADVAVISLVP